MHCVLNLEILKPFRINSRIQAIGNAINFDVEEGYWQYTPLRDTHFVVLNVQQGWTNLDLELSVGKKRFYEVW